MSRIRLLILAALLAFSPSYALAADSTVTALTAASALTGAELMYCVQGGADRKCTYTQAQTFILGSVSGDCTFTGAVLTCTKSSGVAFGTAAFQNTGTSGATLPFANGTNTWANAQTFTTAPVFTDQSGSRTALGLGTAATQNTGTSGATLPFANGVNTWSGLQTYSGGEVNSNSPGLSATAKSFTGTLQAGGTATTNFPHVLIANGSPTPVTTWSTAGTLLGMNPAALSGNFVDFHINGGASLFLVTAAGQLSTTSATIANALNSGGQISYTGSSFAGFNMTSATAAPAYNFRNGASALTSPASSTIQIGQGDSATPSAQSVVAQSVVAGTSNVAGATPFIVRGSLSTGSGVSGDVVISTGGTGAGATAQNAAVAALTVKGATQNILTASPIKISSGYTVGTLPAGTVGMFAYVTDQLTTCAIAGAALTGGGVVTCPVFYNGSAWVGG